MTKTNGVIDKNGVIDLNKFFAVIHRNVKETQHAHEVICAIMKTATPKEKKKLQHLKAQAESYLEFFKPYMAIISQF